MGWSKRQIIEEAFAELALAGYVFDLSPEVMQRALRRLDTMMATWQAKGVSVGYVVGLTPDNSDLDQDSGLPLVATEAVYMSLAVRMAAGEGKALPPSTLRATAEAVNALHSHIARGAVRQQQMRAGTPMGASPYYGDPFSAEPDTQPLRAAQDGGLALPEA